MISFNLNRLFGSLNIRKKFRIAFFLSAVLPLAIGGIYGVYFSSRTLKGLYLHELTREVEERGKELEKTIANVKGDILFLSRLPTLKNFVRHMRRHGEPELLDMRGPVLEAFSNFAKYRTGIYQIRFLDEEGWERLRVDSKNGEVTVTPLERLQYKGDRYYFREAMRFSTDEIYTSPMDPNEEFGRVEVLKRLVVRFATPFIDEQGQKRGTVVLNLYADDLLELIRSLESRPGITTFFANTDGTIISEKEDGGGIVGSIPKERLFSGETVLFEGERQFVIFTPVVYQKVDKRYWVVGLQYPKKILLIPLTEFVSVLVLIGLVIALMELFLGGLAARQLTVPLLAVTREAEKIGRGDFNVHLDVETGDEIENLAHAMNAMALKVRELVEKEKGWSRQLQEEVNRAEAKLKESMGRIYQMEKMASLGELSAGIAHEIGNPLAAIKTVIQAMEETRSPEEQKVYFERILSEIDRLSEFLKTFQTFVAPGEEAFVPCDLSLIAKNVILLVEKEASQHRVRIRDELSSIPPVSGSPSQLEQVLLNLMVNAFHALPEGGEIVLRTSRSPTDPSKICLSVADNGRGISRENLSRIFDPFFTTRPGGSGLGLAIVYKIVKEHGGEISVKSEVGRGTAFEILLPIKESSYA